jgi:hypothetical protein
VTCFCPNGHPIQPIGFKDIAPEYALRIARLLIGDLVKEHQLLPWCNDCGASVESWMVAMDDRERLVAA